MKVKVLKQFLHDRLGVCKVGAEIDLPETQVEFFLNRKAVEVYATKVVEQIAVENVEVVKPTKKRKTKSAQ